jgi:hypothetical protein
MKVTFHYSSFLIARRSFQISDSLSPTTGNNTSDSKSKEYAHCNCLPALPAFQSTTCTANRISTFHLVPRGHKFAPMASEIARHSCLTCSTRPLHCSHRGPPLRHSARQGMRGCLAAARAWEGPLSRRVRSPLVESRCDVNDHWPDPQWQ